jgi:hypothetical protein
MLSIKCCQSNLSHAADGSVNHAAKLGALHPPTSCSFQQAPSPVQLGVMSGSARFFGQLADDCQVGAPNIRSTCWVMGWDVFPMCDCKVLLSLAGCLQAQCCRVKD